MKRASKILTLILVVVFLFGIFAGCDLVGKDVAKYRGVTALKVGNQPVTVGKLLDTFNSYYNNYYYYILYNGWTVDDILDLAIQSLVSQYMRVDAYTSDASHVKVAANGNKFFNAQYLEEYQLKYSVSYVKYLLFTSFDSTVMEKIEAKYELNDEETKDTSRDFYKYDDLKGAATYAEYYRDKNFENEDMSEYIEKYFENNADDFADYDLSKIENQYYATASVKIDELNKRIDDEDKKISDEEYAKIQKAVIKQYQTSVKNNYGLEFNEFVKLQVEDMITSSIINVYNYEIYKQIENDSDLWSTLKGNYDTLAKAQNAKFAIEKGFENYIESLSDSSYIYNVPEGYENSYVFVKNILVPFSASQSAKLKSLKDDLGTDKDEGGYYVKYRNYLATQIVADDFNSEKDKDGKYAVTVKDLFKVEGDKVVINEAAESNALSQYLEGGSVKVPEGKTADEVIKDLMKQFNTDVGQHSSLYSYVVRVGEVPASYNHRWVQEFVDATNDAMAKGGAGHYGIGVSDYGVHIVYVEGYVEAIDELTVANLQENHLKPETVEYKLFKTYFGERSNKLLTEAIDALQKEYSSKVEEMPVFKKFLKENGMKYDLAEALKNDED